MKIDPWDIFNKKDRSKYWSYQVKIKLPLRWIKNLLRKKDK